jgi:hypothetical protein
MILQKYALGAIVKYISQHAVTGAAWQRRKKTKARYYV